jgi:hypothetical protein
MKLFKPESKQKSSQNDVKNSDLGSDINLQHQQQKSNDAGLSFVPFAGDKNTLTNSNKSLANSAIAPKNPLNNPSSKSSSLFAPNSAFVPSTPLRTVPSTALPPISVAPLPPALAPAPAERTYSPPSRNYDSAPAPSYNPPAPRPSTSRANSSPSPARSTPPNSTSPTDNPAPTTVYVTPRSNTAVKYAAPLSSAPAAPAPSSSYRVVVENSYAASAQQVERDAYVRPSDGQVQVGSYRDANAAQQRIEQLRRQGIPARIE